MAYRYGCLLVILLLLLRVILSAFLLFVFSYTSSKSCYFVLQTALWLNRRHRVGFVVYASNFLSYTRCGGNRELNIRFTLLHTLTQLISFACLHMITCLSLTRSSTQAEKEKNVFPRRSFLSEIR